MMMDREMLGQKTADIEDGLRAYLPEGDGYAASVLEAVNYSILAGGKRLRPMLMHEAYKMFGGEDEAAIRPFMAALEMIHTSSLVHDDLPALDNDDYRRGKPAVHKKYGEAMGVLTGDVLLNMAYETAFLAFGSKADAGVVGRALDVLGEKSGVRGMLGGQVVDVEKNGSFLDGSEMYFVYRNKTAALIESALMIGAVLAGAGEDDIRRMEKTGEQIGIAFQIQDDILDVAGDEDVTGKPVHSDEKNEKTTYVSVHGLEESRKKVREYTENGLAEFDGASVKNGEAAGFLRELILSLVGREM